MRNLQRSRESLVFLAACAAGLGAACSEAPVVGGEQGRIVPGAEPCLETRVWLDYTPQRTDLARKTWDPARRVLTAEHAPTTTFDQKTTLQWRYDFDGRVRTYLGFQSVTQAYSSFQHDYSYDEHNNVKEFRTSYPETPDVMVPSTAAPWSGASYENQYEATQRLVASTMTWTGASDGDRPPVRRVYTEDAAGRCARVESTSAAETTVEVRTYDAPGRVNNIEVTAGGTTFTRTFSYDETNRLLVETYTVSGTPFSGTSTTTHTYLPDGSETVASDDGITDVSSDRHITTTRTAACRAIDLAVGSPPDARCRVR